MKLIFRCFILVGLIIGLGCTDPAFSTGSNPDSDCQRTNSELILWTIVDDDTGNGIGGAYGTLWYGTGISDFVGFSSTDSGLGSFCFPIGGVILDGFIRAEGYEQIDLTDLIPSDVSILRLIPLD